ncbi:ATP-dependent RNA helicase ddx24 [Musca domestica]|uniref:ATP-dependent RNA helicase DDX24 n=1 Tax=Musca domestica TaxID=7370 RepID=A0A1I8MQD4_MUSDO|nr:ATP-dependent RNA helicase ddx24 [Musca domestica]
MVQNKQRGGPKAKLPRINKNDASWEKVKIKGNVVSEDGVGLEGLIGLEVLETYDPALVEMSKPKSTRKEKRMERKKANKKPKKTSEENDEDDDNENSDDSLSESEDDSDDDNEGGKKSKKASYKERLALKLQKRRERREQRKLQRKLAKKQGGGAVTNDNKNDKKKPKDGKKNKKSKETESKDDAEGEEYNEDRFKLLRPPQESDEDEQKVEDDDDDSEEEEAPELVDSKALSIDDLEGWNGLGVPQCILKALAEKGFKSPTEIQSRTLPAAILGKKDILGAAETGSGKTLAFGIPLLAGIMELKKKNSKTGIRKPLTKTKEKHSEDNEIGHKEEFEVPMDVEESDEESEEEDENQSPLYGLVLTPTRELAVQVKNHIEAAAKYTGIKVAAIFGGLAVAKQERVLKKCPEIVVATPGRFWELYQQDNKHLRHLEDISFLVIDETDRMVEKGHFEELRQILKLINDNEQKKQSRQNFVFSATLTLVHDLPEHMQKRNFGKKPKFVKQTAEDKIQNLIDELGISQPKIVDITRSQQTAQNLTECRLICPLDQKDYYLYYFVQRHPGRTIVFCNSIDCVKRLANLFGLLKCEPLPLHANMIQKQRLKNLERFRDNPCGFLIATDVAARGLDIPNVEHVIHYQVPRTSENYVHRSGRTARANKDGITVMFMEPGEVKNYVKLYKTLERKEDLPLFPVSERYLAAVRERVDLAREVDRQELKLKRVQSEMGWMKKIAEEMDMVIDGFNDESGSDQDEDAFIIEKRRNRIHLANVRQQLKSLLAQPIFPRGFSFKYPTATGGLQVPEISSGPLQGSEQKPNSAVKAMQEAIEDMKKAKKMRNKKKK